MGVVKLCQKVPYYCTISWIRESRWDETLVEINLISWSDFRDSREIIYSIYIYVVDGLHLYSASLTSGHSKCIFPPDMPAEIGFIWCMASVRIGLSSGHLCPAWLETTSSLEQSKSCTLPINQSNLLRKKERLFLQPHIDEKGEMKVKGFRQSILWY